MIHADLRKATYKARSGEFCSAILGKWCCTVYYHISKILQTKKSYTRVLKKKLCKDLAHTSHWVHSHPLHRRHWQRNQWFPQIINQGIDTHVQIFNILERHRSNSKHRIIEENRREYSQTMMMLWHVVSCDRSRPQTKWTFPSRPMYTLVASPTCASWTS